MAWIEYQAVAAFYGQRRARRSGVAYMVHIDQGLALLEALGASETARRAFCLHPLVQSDDDVRASWPRLHEATHDPRVTALVFEYRHIANAYLSRRVIASADEIALSSLAEVNDMLRADKIQNHFDFVRHHASSHPRAAALETYFQSWFTRLGISPARLAVLQGML